MKLLLKILVCLLCALALGVGYASLRQTGENIMNGPWRTNLTTGSAEAGLHHRARVAWRGQIGRAHV